MTYLLDTHVMLQAALEPEKLSSGVVEILSSEDNTLLISSASVWEIAVKVSIGKLPLPMDLKAFVHTTISRLSAVVIHVSLNDTLELAGLPFHHRDPFDRMLIAQARNHAVPFISADQKMLAYDIEVIR